MSWSAASKRPCAPSLRVECSEPPFGARWLWDAQPIADEVQKGLCSGRPCLLRRFELRGGHGKASLHSACTFKCTSKSYLRLVAIPNAFKVDSMGVIAHSKPPWPQPCAVCGVGRRRRPKIWRSEQDAASGQG